MDDRENLRLMAIGMFQNDVAEDVIEALDHAPKATNYGVESLEWDTSESAPFSALTLGYGDRFYRKLAVGKFEGRIELSWNGVDKDGIDSFVYTPHPTKAFAYTTTAGRRIVPHRMLTDGGSIPSLLRGINQLTPWRYAPAYMIHDWLFVAKKCRSSSDMDWGFEQTAEVMAEAMKTMMEVGFTDAFDQDTRYPKNADILYLMYLAVGSKKAKRLWDDDSTVKCIPESEHTKIGEATART